MPPLTRRARVRAKFAVSAETHMLAKLKVDVAVFDMGEGWEVMRRDGLELTPAQLRAFNMYRAGYRILNPDA
jgi:hypothetical protein